MAAQFSKRIDRTFNTLAGDIELRVDNRARAKADKLIRSLSRKDRNNIIHKATRIACIEYGNTIVTAARRCIVTGIPPKGYTWPALSDFYSKTFNKSKHSFYSLTGQYYRSIAVRKEKASIAGGNGRTKEIISVGLPSGVKKEAVPGGFGPQGLTLVQVARLLETGGKVGKGRIPPRPLWKGLFEQFPTDRQIKARIRKEILNYISYLNLS